MFVVRRVVEAVVPARLGNGFRWLLASSWATNLSDGIAVAAGPLLVASLTANPLLVALAALLRWAPPLVFGLWAGVLSDRLDRRRIVLVANAVRVGALGVLVGVLVTGRVSVPVVLLTLALLATAEVFVDNTTGTLTPMLVRREDLAIANARVLAGLITLNKLTGPAIGAVLFAAGRSWPFATNTILIAAGLLLVSRVSLPPRERESTGHPRDLRSDIAAGFRWTVRHPAVRTLCLTALVFNITYGAAWSILVLYAGARLGLGAVGFGLLSTATAAGGLLATVGYGWLSRRVSLGDIMRAGLIIETLTHLGLAVTTSPWVAAAILFVFGAHAFTWGTTALTIRHRAVPTHLQGRVASVYTMSGYGGLVVGAALGGPLVTLLGTTGPFWFAFAGSALLVGVLWRRFAHIAHTDDPAPTPAPAGATAG
ncbi:MFS transporter [Salinispora tropica]|uniref:Major facilitator superfamily MFS_1 n=1 Tax=Salinispora tropica (strain ATCC BAA-916 / DSM 44818 / JCM 13857 / NBRC 105044 / CNB-440) TaxID=369723 RepID=A4X1T2_SALTO|nr:MFS transporter [Salinispora tropica]ABP52832.1 major facilitator superfamily MFS_1 [Salinispora tropica CNB-440]